MHVAKHAVHVPDEDILLINYQSDSFADQILYLSQVSALVLKY